MREKRLKMPAAKLVLDFTNYPRHAVDDVNVSDLVRVLASGGVLPPIIADRLSLRVVDGFHRHGAHLKHFGDGAILDVILRDYKDEAEFFRAATEANVSHGRKLDKHDRTRIVLRLRELGVDDRTIAQTLHVPEDHVTTLALNVVLTPVVPAQLVPSKRGFEHMRGAIFTETQLHALKTVRSGEAGRIALELIRLLNADCVNRGSEQIVSRLRELSDVLLAWLPPAVPAVSTSKKVKITA